MKTILDFIRDASPWVAIGFALGILASRSAANKSGRKKQDDNYAIEGMCIGMSFGTALEAARGRNTGLGSSLGMLLGLAAGMCIPKRPRPSSR